MRKLYNEFKADLSQTDKNTAFAMVYAAIAMTGNYYLSKPQNIADWLKNTSFAEFGNFLVATDTNNLPALSFWIFVLFLFYFVVPTLIIKFIFNRHLSDYGLNFKIEKDFWKIYLQCAGVMIPLVYVVSLTEGFSNKYPFLGVYDNQPYFSSTLLIWELIYFFQFFGLEFFFRGFLVNSLKPKLGIYAIFVMTIPYCMIHFGKPPLETLAAIFAGIFLGWLSYKNNNIWLGLLLHCTVAFEMDILALHHKGLLF
jgi:uncharacterized protein